jgi:hypothetical protein
MESKVVKRKLEDLLARLMGRFRVPLTTAPRRLRSAS